MIRSLGTHAIAPRTSPLPLAALSVPIASHGSADSRGPSVAPVSIDAARAASLIFKKQGTQPVQKCWEVPGTPMRGPLADSRGNLYASLSDQKVVVSLSPETGVTRWTASIHPTCRPLLTPDEKLLLVCADDDQMHALDPASGVELWTTAASGGLLNGADGHVYTWWNGLLSRIDLDRRSVAECTRLEHGFEAPPAVGRDGTIYGGAYNGRLYAIEPGTARVKWTHQTGGMLRNSPVVGPDGTVYAGCIGKALVAVDPKDGSGKWLTLTGHWIMPEPAIGDDGTVYVGSCDNKVYALDPTCGKPLWTFEADGEIRVRPVPARDGVLYVVSDRNRLYGIDQRNGAELWSTTADSYVHCPPAVDHRGGLVVGVNNGKTCAYRHTVTAERVQQQEMLHDAQTSDATTQAPPAPTIEQHDGWVIVGGVRIPVNHGASRSA
ncbi:MAG: hypothetical protein EB084_12210 [Proteobacteria bacterium]|nr:hypothetical protein [Pseudomonadota bacterium]